MEEKTMIQFTEEEVTKIQGLQQKVLTINARIGEIELLIHGLEREFQELKNEKQALIGEYANIRQEEVELSSELKEKYGEGTYDISTNQFTPTK